MILLWIGIVYKAHNSYYQIYASYPHSNCDTITAPLHTEWELQTRSIFSSISLFAFSIDSNAIDGWIAESNAEDTQVSETLHKCATAAGVWTLVFVFILLFRAFHLWFWRVIRSMLLHKNLYVFWGINQRSIRLAAELSRKDIFSRILFVTEPGDMPNDVSQGLSQILHRSRRRNELQKAVGLAKASVLITEKPITDFEAINMWTWVSMRLGIMWGNIFLTCGKIHVMLLGEDETKNIYDALALSNAKLWGCSCYYDKLTIHCHARRGNANRVIEDITAKGVIEVIDSSHLSIELLKRDVKNHPVSFVELSDKNPGTVASPFRSLIIGFSECGQDALRFLYEFSAFVDEKCGKDEDIRSPFYCDIVDKQFDAASARWINHAPGVFRNNDTKGIKKITFHPKMDYGSEEFYKEVLSQIISELNYVVIAVGDDRAGITLAVDILRYAIKTGRVNYENTGHRFRIYVRSYDPNMYDYMNKIANFYNQKGKDVFIQLFGAEKDLYSKEMLIDEALRKQAKHYSDAYNVAYNEQKQKNKEAFDDSSPDLPECPVRDKIDKRRKDSQNFANALHLMTKGYIQAKSKRPVPIVRLAQTEHLRWWAAHEILGYRCLNEENNEKDILIYVHNCMKPWSKLRKAQVYDFLTCNKLYTKDELTEAIEKVEP